MMIRFSSWALGIVALSVSTTGFARSEDPRLKLGLRLGYAVPLGDLAEGVKMSAFVSGQVPIWIDAGYMVTPNVLLGLYGQYSVVQAKNCDDCSGHDIRFGLQGQYHVLPGQAVDPWLGLGVGYERLTLGDQLNAKGEDVTYQGFELANLQAGADFEPSDAFTLGPFLSFSLAQYSSFSMPEGSGDITHKAWHEWLTFGVKGTFGL